MSFSLPDRQTVGAEVLDVTIATVPPDSAGVIRAEVSAWDHNGNIAVWFMRIGFWRIGEGLISSPTAAQDIVTKKTAGMTAANAEAVTSGDNIYARITGVTGLTLDWRIFNEQPEGMTGPFA